MNGNFLYQGQPGGKFVDVTSTMKLPQPVGLVGAAVVDLDNDGWEDLILGSQILRNNKGREFQPIRSTPGRVFRQIRRPSSPTTIATA